MDYLQIEFAGAVSARLVTGLSQSEAEGWRDAGCGDWIGHYDFLRDAERRIVGLRVAPHEPAYSLLKARLYQPLPEQKDWFIVVWNRDAKWVEEYSDDQIIDDARVLVRDDSDALGLLFSLDILPEGELEQLSRAVMDDCVWFWE